MKKLIFSAVSLMLLAGALGSCSTQKKGDAEQQMQDNTELTEEEAEELEKTVEQPKLRFDSAEDAKRYMDESDDCKLYSQGILYEMADDSLDYCQRLLNSRFERFIIVDKGDMKVKLYDRYGRLEKAYRCAAGKGYGNKKGKGDCRTPEGFFPAGAVMNSTNWHYTDENGRRSEKPGQYGPRFFRIVCPKFWSTGIHGTDAPWTIGRRCSHGCVRLKNEDILDLVKYVVEGMPIIVKPGPKDIQQNEYELKRERGELVDSIDVEKPHTMAADSVVSRHDSVRHKPNL